MLRSLFVFLACALAVASPPAAAFAQDASALAIGPRQIEAFANLVDEPVETVAEHLRRDPTIIPVVVEAADARMSRKRSGKWMMVGGFSLFGLGTGTAAYGLLHQLGRQQLWCEGSCPTTPMNSQERSLLIGGLLTAAVGLVLAIPGVIAVARQTDVETEAVNRYEPAKSLYEPAFPPESARLVPAGAGAKAIRMSLLDLSF